MTTTLTIWTRVKHGAKVGTAYLLYYTGILLLWQRRVLRRRAVVLMYHRVLTRDEAAATASHPALVVGCETFARQMATLKRHFVVLSVDQLAEHLEQRRPLPDRSCLITFDDGWRDNYENALPILERYDLPALIFLPANYIGRRRMFWQEALTHLLLAAIATVAANPQRRPALAALLAPSGLDQVLDLPSNGARPAVIAAVSAGKTNVTAMRGLIATLAEALDIDVDQLPSVVGFMDWDQAAAMATRRIAFGGHGAEHLLLTQVTPGEVASELRCSKHMLDTRFPDTVATFSYPNGYHSTDIVASTAAAGFRLAFITKRGYVSCDSDPFTLTRRTIQESVTASAPMFMARVVGLY